jgi:uncharacterized protein
LSEIRLDKVYIPKVTKTKEGFLKGIATVTRTGVFKYRNFDGSERLELRHPDDVLLSVSLDSLKSIPITNDHPKQLLNIDNVGNLMIGMTGETVIVDDDKISTSISITHKDGIAAISEGKRELSLGYSLDTIEEVGEYNGEKYTHRQKNIFYNHLSLVKQARAGRSARVNLDGVSCKNEANIYYMIEGDIKDVTPNNIAMDKIDESLTENPNFFLTKEDNMTDTTFHVDEIDKKTRAEKTTEKMITLTKNEHDRIDAVIDQLKAENTQLKAVNMDALIAEGVKNRLSLLSKIGSVINTDGLVDKTDREIMELVITKYNPNLNYNLKEKTDAYISGRFDAIIEGTSDNKAIMNQMSNLINMDSKKEISALDILKNHSKKGN